MRQFIALLASSNQLPQGFKNAPCSPDPVSGHLALVHKQIQSYSYPFLQMQVRQVPHILYRKLFSHDLHLILVLVKFFSPGKLNMLLHALHIIKVVLYLHVHSQRQPFTKFLIAQYPEHFGHLITAYESLQVGHIRLVLSALGYLLNTWHRNKLILPHSSHSTMHSDTGIFSVVWHLKHLPYFILLCIYTRCTSQIINFLFYQIIIQKKDCHKCGWQTRQQVHEQLHDIISPLMKIFMQRFQNKKAKCNIEIKISDLENETVSLKNVSFELLDQYREKFKKCIKQPIRVYQQICQQKFPQKCMIHGMGYALYCITENKLLCSRCMYQNNAHRNHSVKPMNQCLSNISKECEKTMKEIKQITENIQELDEYVKKQIFLIERQFPVAKQKISSIFKCLHQMLFDQQKWCMKEIRQFKAELIEQKNLISKQMNNTKMFIEETLSKYHNKNSTEEVLAKKSIYESLVSVPDVIKQLKIDPNNNDPKFKFNDQIQENILSFCKEQFMNLLPWGKEKKQKELSKSKSPKQKSRKKSNNSKKISKKQKIKEEPKPEKSLNNSKQKTLRLKNQTISPLSSTKNRSSKSCKNMFGESPKNRRSYLMTKNSLLIVNGQQKSKGLSPKNQLMQQFYKSNLSKN